MTNDFEKLLKEKSFDYTPTVRQRFHVGELPKVMSLPDIRVISVKDLKESELKVFSRRELAELLAEFIDFTYSVHLEFPDEEITNKWLALRFLKERGNGK